MLKQIKLVRKGLSVERLHTLPHITPYNNGFHSANVAYIALELCTANGINPANCVIAGLMHDVHESYIGDTPANVKVDNPELKTLMTSIESKWESDNGLDLPDLSDVEKSILKIADLVELGMYCLDELKMGNSNMKFVIRNVILYLGDYVRLNIKGSIELYDYLASEFKPYWGK